MVQSVSTMRGEQTFSNECFDSLLTENPKLVEESFAILEAQQRERRVLFRDQLLPSSITPHIVPEAAHKVWVSQLTELFEDLERLGTEMLHTKELYSRLRLPKEARALMDIDPGFRRLAVVSRLDMVWSQERAFVYEINTDSPAMMTFTDYIEGIIRELHPMNELRDLDKRPGNRTKVLHDSLIECYREWGGNKASPTIAIIDWRDQKTADELIATSNEFTALGSPSFVCDPRELSIQNRKLVAKGREIDIVQRRVLFPEFLARPSEVQTLVDAYRQGLICMANPLRSYLLGNKSLLSILSGDRGASKVGNEIVLPTINVDESNISSLKNRGDWVLKGALGHGGHEVVLGVDQTEESWERALAACRDSSWVAQRYLRPPKMRVPIRVDGKIKNMELWANWNPFYFGGRFAGGMTRVSSETIVSITANGALMPTITRSAAGSRPAELKLISERAPELA